MIFLYICEVFCGGNHEALMFNHLIFVDIDSRLCRNREYEHQL